ncbi:MAG: hypothetical protein CMI75_04325 [Candidatus Pelagibacter sp.]|nr:hypothetical protein [Candidatus Pelagibacter sp.]
MKQHKVELLFPWYSLIYKLDYFLSAYFKYFIHKIIGGNYLNRLSNGKNRISLIELEQKILSNKKKRVALFVAYHKKHEIPLSNKEYLKFLSNCSFSVIYIHNGKLDEKVINELEESGCFVICRKNLGQDFGAWKDLLLLLEKLKLSDYLDWTLMCNDSNFYLGGENGKIFERRFLKELEKENPKDFISLNCNYEMSMHHQSYFLCLSNKILKNKKFIGFWKNYMPLNNRYHAIDNGEKKLSKKILNYYKPRILLTTYGIYKNLNMQLKDDSLKNIIEILPKNVFHLESCFNESGLDQYTIQKILHVLDNYNPSHAFAIMYILYHQSPFLKKDIIRQGTFSPMQIEEFICSNNMINNDLLKDEIITHCLTDGTPLSFLEDLRLSYRKGICGFGQNYKGYEDSQIYLKKYMTQEKSF